MSLRWMVFLASGLVVMGIVGGLADAFILNWESASLGHPDIAARGPFLVGLYLPLFVLISYSAAVVAAALGRIPATAGWLWTLGLAAAGTVAGLGVLMSPLFSAAHASLVTLGGGALVSVVDLLLVVAGASLLVSKKWAALAPRHST